MHLFILGPCLLLFYINDLPVGISSKVRLFADDTIVYLTINNNSDANKLQDDLNKLERWEEKWKMQFHPEKCQVLTVSRNKTKVMHKYTLHGHQLENVDEAKYLGITISSDLRWNRHIDNIKAKQTTHYPSFVEISKSTLPS